ncbi:RecQ family ATP-dependent DNA helicase [Micromonospora sp. DSM 115977]|uniref:ATP-dependent DNA helicase RecQ n=1 Tax=Micromonospora reichwaldensis TaxID=3075516 RepID=A0ABU2X289_9ACTN|nr:RecQ family ATP-dependent DNA helicase [Micromonospora sp. DSM 115977]MDT0532300.1 RecQ family ATP-dependent DNA helicase [Micromonospora sp. DSM 115977]
MDSRALPPNVAAACDVIAQRGPLTPDEIVNVLRESGIVLTAVRVAKLPERFPLAFVMDAHNRLSFPPRPASSADRERSTPTSVDHADAGLAWHTAKPPVAVPLDDLVVVMPGLSRCGDEVDLAVIRMRDHEARVFAAGPDRPGMIREFVAGAAGLVGFGLTSHLWARMPDDILRCLPEARSDLRILTLLHEPTRPSGRLSEVCALLGVAYPEQDVLGAARAVADCLRILVGKVDSADGSWQLARACLVAGGSPLASLLPEAPLPQGVRDVLLCAPDPLLEPAAGPEYRTAADAVRQVFGQLGERGYAARPAQREMAGAVAEVLDAGGLLAIEAPTGTGKSLAYLTPAGGRAGREQPVVVATATKVLQQQLRRDVTRLRGEGLLHAPFRQLFGVANYLCSREIAAALESSDESAGADHWLALAVAVRALAVGEAGVWDDVADTDITRVSLDYRGLRDTLRTDAPSCERHDCAWVTRCPLFTRLVGLRERPGLLAVNHALIASWAKLAQQGHPSPGDVLAEGRGDLVFDEAHELEDSLTAAWTEAVGRREIVALATRIDGKSGLDRHLRRLAAHGLDLRRERRLPAMARQLRKDGDRLTDVVQRYLHEYGGATRSAVFRTGVVQTRPEYRQLVDEVRQMSRGLRELTDELTGLETRARARLPEASQRARMPLKAVLTRVVGLLRAVREVGEVLGRLRDLPDEHLWVYRLSGLLDPKAGIRTDHLPETGAAIDGAVEEPRQVDWSFECIPVDVGPAFADGIVRPARSVTLASATLTTGGTFDYLADRLGIRVERGSAEPGVFDGRQLCSPYDYAAQSAVVLTNHLPVPVPGQEREFVEEFARDQVGLLSLTGGRAMTLFAARRRMEAVADLVRQQSEPLAERGVHLLVQGEAGRAEISERFRAEPGSVVYGLRSYWQGFDAPGETLSYLVIEKPPYPHPDDAVVSARARAAADRGGDPFLDYLVPKTAVLLAQGFGRLIRSETDRGVALVYDRRMQSPGTANRLLLSTLPGPAIHHAADRDDAWRFALEFVTGETPDLTDALSLARSDVDTALLRLRLQPGEDPEPKLREAARLLFGVEELRDAQVELMRAHLAGVDTVGVLPTGTGKSLCFQLPALLRPEERATVVVSPLVALIKDQVDDLRGRRGLRGVQGITGNTPAAVRNEILRDLAAGKVRLLYVSPERLVRDPVLRVALERQDLGGLVVDEAHCVSAWGHDFRPEFRQVSRAVAHLSRAPRMALTATATTPVLQDVVRALELSDPVAVSRPADRPNLRFQVTRVGGERERARELLRITMAMGSSPGIVYASRRAVTEEVAALLRRAGVRARHYHAGMVPEQREAVQDDFLAGTTQVIVATKAFGMGVNKPDVGWVVHYDMPESLDAYVQEAGRAARSADLRGQCVLLYSGGDVARRRAQVADTSDAHRLGQAHRVLELLLTQRRRGGDVVFDQEELAEAVAVEPDELNVLLGWLERAGAVEQLPDCSARGTVHVGNREPEDLQQRRRFRELSVLLKLRPLVGSRIDFDRLEEEHGVDPDELERDLVAWSLDRLVTFSSSRRYRRLRLLSVRVESDALQREIRRWNVWQRRQLDAMISYLDGVRCRRAAVVDYFGFPPYSCGVEHEACDNCGGTSPWHDLPSSAVPDPEQLVNVELTVLQAVAWASTLRTGRYGVAGLKAAVLGVEVLAGGHPIGAGLRRCPQFGALRHVRGADRRWDEATGRLVGDGLLIRDQIERDSRSYTSLAITDAGQERLGGRRG